MTKNHTKKDEKPEVVERRRPARRTILEAGRRILLRDGMDALTTEAVAKESGLLLEVVQAYFCNTDELVLSIASDELTMLSRAATGDKKFGRESSEEMGILSLPKMAESFIAARAESVAGSDSRKAGDRGEIGAAAEKIRGTTATETPPPQCEGTTETENHDDVRATPTVQEDTHTLRASGSASDVDGIIKGVAADNGSRDGDISALVARLERRVYVIERNLAEEAEKVSKEKMGKLAIRRVEIEQFATRIDALERHLAEISEELLLQRTKSPAPVRIPEATPAAGSSLAQGVPGVVEIATPTVENAPNNYENDARGDNGGEAEESLEAFLSARRETAKIPVEPMEPSDFDRSDSWLLRSKRQADGLLQRCTKLEGKALLTWLAPVPIVLTGLVLTTWTAMGAGEDLESALLDVSPAAPETAIALEMSSAPQPTLSRLEAMMAAADSGDSDAQTALGLNYLNGEGVASDKDEALRWLQLASGNGQAVAQYTLATIYAGGEGTSSDPLAAKFWFQSAAEQGNRMAMNNLAMFYAQGLGTEQDSTEAAHWFAMAAALGFKVAQFNLAVLYERGDGVPQDNVEAYRWYAIASAQGDKDAQERAEFLAEKLDPDVLLVLRNEVSSFRPAAVDPKVNSLPQFNSSTG